MSAELEHSQPISTEASPAVSLALQGWTWTMTGNRRLVHELPSREGVGQAGQM